MSELSHATGFFYEHEGVFYLTTNWHVLTGRNFQTGELLESLNDIPTHISVTLTRTQNHPEREHGFLIVGDGEVRLQEIPLYSGSGPYSERNPVWIEHPRGREIDIVAIRMDYNFECTCGQEHTYYHAEHDELSLGSELNQKVSMDAFILGYPGENYSGGLSNFPIWKRASIASEPSFPVNGLPMIYLDTASRPGMSGSPVYYRSESFPNIENMHISVAYETQFLGIYSGRIVSNDPL